ncbi:hypothetical protein ASPBRDRAFT_645756 [Aspergillus brasiliensis CBS 101740]|uniref:Uncharacterized protein n=1 Tax=Aspergillus brasiliensis (strain CBS 101740 / IMI 381727 / IBT 21946) TaxID=767769 RepID=A0A1L9UE55_ASPBC|nr:hypothetical protein ASPBRDRAFT_645756 [Aspergillus brasiliensis CBS 101740]
MDCASCVSAEGSIPVKLQVGAGKVKCLRHHPTQSQASTSNRVAVPLILDCPGWRHREHLNSQSIYSIDAIYFTQNVSSRRAHGREGKEKGIDIVVVSQAWPTSLKKKNIAGQLSLNASLGSCHLHTHLMDPDTLSTTSVHEMHDTSSCPVALSSALPRIPNPVYCKPFVSIAQPSPDRNYIPDGRSKLQCKHFPSP